MSRMLFLCEKPSQARDIARVMGTVKTQPGYLCVGEHLVTWCIGHLLEMADPQAYDATYRRWRIEDLPICPDQWQLTVRKTVFKQYRVVERLVNQAGAVVVATDADREGEVIAREILERCRYRGTVQRLWLRALDRASIEKALADMKPGESTEPLYHAGLGRARSDWLVGMNMTRAYTLIGQAEGRKGVVSVGRVQTPTLALIVQRDRQIESFKPVPYYVPWIDVDSPQGPFRAHWMGPEVEKSAYLPEGFDSEGRCVKHALAFSLEHRVNGQRGQVTVASRTRKKQPPPLPFALSALQQVCSARFAMGAQDVLNVAQSLYETRKVISYPRTDCGYLPQDQFEQAGQIVECVRQSGIIETAAPNEGFAFDDLDLTQRSRAWNDKKITAHHGMIPTAVVADPATLTREEQQVYRLIVQHYLAQFLPEAEHDHRQIVVTVKKERFQASGTVPVVEGWKTLFPRTSATDRGEDEETDDPSGEARQALPDVRVGAAITVARAGIDRKKTTPPKRFTEGTLIGVMSRVGAFVDSPVYKRILKETEGIGTEATRAGIIQTLLKRRYVTKKGKALVSTAVGRDLVDAVPSDLKEAGSTAVMERALAQVAQGELSLTDYMARQTKTLARLVAQARRQLERTAAQRPAAAEGSSREGAWKVQGVEERAFVVLSDLCPQCGKALRKRKGKYGMFVGCSGYPACRYVRRGE